MSQLFFWFLLFILPFVINPFGGAFYESPKVIMAEVVVEMLMVYFLLRHKINIKKAFLYSTGLIFLISLAGLIFHPSSIALFGNQFRLQGTFLVWHLLIFALISSQFELKIPKILTLLLLPILLIATVLLGTESNGRAFATLGEPNALAAVAIFFWPFAWFIPVNQLSLGQKNKWLIKYSSLLLALLIILLSGSRSGFVALVTQTLLLLSFHLTKNLKLALGIGLLLFLASILLPFFPKNTGYKFENRAEVWRVSAVAGLEKPLTGQGFGNIENVLKSTSQKLNSDLQYQYVDSTHNVFLDYWVESGLLGFGVLGFLVTSSFKTFLASKKVKEILLILGLLIVLSFNPASVVILIAFWWLIGQGFRVSD